MQLLPNLGRIALSPPDAKLIADGLDHYASALDCDKDELRFLHCLAMSCAFEALALAMAYEFYLTPADQASAMAWVNIGKEART